MLTRLFTHGPATPGIFRKSAAHAACREAKTRLNAGHELNFADLPIHVTASLLKVFLLMFFWSMSKLMSIILILFAAEIVLFKARSVDFVLFRA